MSLWETLLGPIECLCFDMCFRATISSILPILLYGRRRKEPERNSSHTHNTQHTGKRVNEQGQKETIGEIVGEKEWKRAETQMQWSRQRRRVFRRSSFTCYYCWCCVSSIGLSFVSLFLFPSFFVIFYCSRFAKKAIQWEKRQRRRKRKRTSFSLPFGFSASFVEYGLGEFPLASSITQWPVLSLSPIHQTHRNHCLPSSV